MMKKLKIGNVNLDNNVVLAPMAGVTDITFRTIFKNFGAGLVHTEMISAKGLYYQDAKTEHLMKIREKNRPVSLQIFGSNPDIMSFAVENYINQREDIDIIDINMGCPAPKIVRHGEGSALMKEPELAGKIIKEIKSVSLKPITVKIRSGWDENNINAVEFAKILVDNGADAITVHGRSREQFYSGHADYNIIRQVKEAVQVPVIGNGDIFQPSDAQKMIDETNCDGVMIGRGALGNPWLIMNTVNLLAGEHKLYEATAEDKIKMLKLHTQMMSEELNEKIALLEMRKHAGWYIKGLENSAAIKNKINTINKSEDLFSMLDEYLNILQTKNKEKNLKSLT